MSGSRLTLGGRMKLGAVQPGLLALDFTGVTRHEPGLAQRGLERGFVVDQGAGDAVARGAGLAGFAATVDIDLDVEGFDMVGQDQGLLGNHDRGFTTEIVLNILAIDRDLAGAFFQENAGDAGLATAGSIFPFTNHLKAPLISNTLGCWAVCGCSAPPYTLSFLIMA